MDKSPHVTDNEENFLNSEEEKYLVNEIPYTNYRLGRKEVISNILGNDRFL